MIAPSPAPEGDGGAPAPEAALAAGDVAEAKPSPTSRPGTDTRDRTVQQEEFALATDAGARPVRPDAAGARLLDRDAPAPTPRKHDEFVFLDADAARGLPAFWFVDGGPAGWVPRNAYIGGAGEEATFEFEIPDPDPVGAAEGPGAAGSGELALGPLASFQPEAAALDLGLQQFLDRLGDLGRELGRSLEKGGVMPWLAALTVAAAALEVSRRRKGRQLPRVALAGGDEESTLTWAAGLPGPPASEES